MSHADDFERLLLQASKPSRYLGNEINVVKKDLSRVSLFVCLAFPDVYEVGMSHLGMHILYHVLNSRSDIACERVFAPWPDLEHQMQLHDLPLLTLESRVPVRNADIVGFSLEYELAYATVLRMLAAAHIPLNARERDTNFPLLIAGGPCTYNPEPVADFFDAFIIGEGEEVLLELCTTYLWWRRNKKTKPELLEALAEIPGVYVPSLFESEYSVSGELQALHPRKDGYTQVLKRVVKNFNTAPCGDAPLVPYVQTVHDRAQIEMARGCTRGCRFCMAGMIYRPVREKSISCLQSLAGKVLAATGYEELSPVSLSAGDYAGINDFIRLLITRYRDDRVAISLPSVRVATLTQDMIQEIKRVRKTGFTIAPEAGSPRLRRVINKGIDEQEILETAARVFDAGWKLLKLYFMIGLPTETSHDIHAIIDLCRTIADRHRGKQLNVSISTFVPKPHTPFQWEAQEHPDTIHEKQRLLKRRLHHGMVQVKYHDRFVSLLEGVFSRGDRRLGSVLQEAHRRGAGFEAWSEYFNYSLWCDAFAACGIDFMSYLRERDPDKLLPWSHIRCGVTLDFLKCEREKALREEPTPDCRQGVCNECGVCTQLGLTPEIAATHQQPYLVQQVHQTSENHSVWIRLHYSKTGTARFLSHLELSRALARAMRRAGLPLQYSQGFHPLPRIVLYNAVPVGIECLGEVCDVELRQPVAPHAVSAALHAQLPPGIAIEAVSELTKERQPPPENAHRYRICPAPGCEPSWMDRTTLEQRVADFYRMPTFPITFVRNGITYTADLKKIVLHLTCRDPYTLEFDIACTGSKTPKVAVIASRIMKRDEHELRIVKLPVPPSDTSSLRSTA